MIISFFGHADFLYDKKIKEKLLNELNKLAKDRNIDFYLGGYGNFDSFAKNICLEFKRTHSSTKLFYITPYLTPSFLKNKQPYLLDYDQILSFDCANKSNKYSIIKRNERIVQSSDFIFFFVQKSFGGAYRTLQYAKRLKKPILNLAE